MITSRESRLAREQSLAVSLLIIGVAILVSYAIVAQATSKSDIVHPVSELGNCKDEAACRAFCDSRDNLDRVKACIAFAKKHNLLPPDEIEEAEHYVTRIGIATGPGGCRSERECDAYCEDTAHLDECLDFAERYNLRSPDDIAEGRKILSALSAGANLPGGCRNKDECLAYCEDPSHMKECVAFAEKAGFISKEEAEEAAKIIPLLERGEKTPGNCSRKAACETYCMEPSHIDECLAFAEKANLIPPEELADAKRFAPYIKNGETPGQCKRKSDCETYCSDLTHFEECVAFAEKAGMMSKEDAELARKVKGTGPGGCNSAQACEAFCSQPENQETCINFAKEHGLTQEIAEVEAKVRGEVESKMRACAEKPCAEMIACLQSLQTGAQGSLEGGEESLPSEVQTKLDSCIEDLKARAIEEAVKTQRGEGATPPGPSPAPGETPQSEEYKRQYEEQYKKQYEEEYQRQYQEQLKANCPLFEQAPSCDYVGAPGSQNYNLCKQCFPNK